MCTHTENMDLQPMGEVIQPDTMETVVVNPFEILSQETLNRQ